MSKYIFLDIDGCLAPFGRENPMVWGHAECENLRILVEETDARVKLVSSWPEQDAREQLEAMGITLHGALARPYRHGMDWHDDYAQGCGYKLREAGIFLCVQARKPEAWVWIDDWWGRGMMPKNHFAQDHYVDCDWVHINGGTKNGRGFDADALELARRILSNWSSFEKGAS